MPRETNLLLVQVTLDGDERRKGMMNRPCVEDVYGEAKLGGQHGSHDA